MIALLIAFLLAGNNPHIVSIYHNTNYQIAMVACNGENGLFLGYETPAAWKRQPQKDQRWGKSWLVVSDRLQVVEGPVSQTGMWTGGCDVR
jgi:hypothetical protein